MRPYTCTGCTYTPVRVHLRVNACTVHAYAAHTSWRTCARGACTHRGVHAHTSCTMHSAPMHSAGTHPLPACTSADVQPYARMQSAHTEGCTHVGVHVCKGCVQMKVHACTVGACTGVQVHAAYTCTSTRTVQVRTQCSHAPLCMHASPYTHTVHAPCTPTCLHHSHTPRSGHPQM